MSLPSSSAQQPQQVSGARRAMVAPAERASGQQRQRQSTQTAQWQSETRERETSGGGRAASQPSRAPRPRARVATVEVIDEAAAETAMPLQESQEEASGLSIRVLGADADATDSSDGAAAEAVSTALIIGGAPAGCGAGEHRRGSHEELATFLLSSYSAGAGPSTGGEGKQLGPLWQMSGFKTTADFSVTKLEQLHTGDVDALDEKAKAARMEALQLLEKNRQRGEGEHGLPSRAQLLERQQRAFDICKQRLQRGQRRPSHGQQSLHDHSLTAPLTAALSECPLLCCALLCAVSTTRECTCACGDSGSALHGGGVAGLQWGRQRAACSGGVGAAAARDGGSGEDRTSGGAAAQREDGRAAPTGSAHELIGSSEACVGGAALWPHAQAQRFGPPVASANWRCYQSVAGTV